MARRSTSFAARLARLEDAHRADLWAFTLDDGRTGSVRVGAVLDAMNEALDRIRAPDADHPPPSRTLRLLARVADGTEPSLLGAAAVMFARQAITQPPSSTAPGPATGDAPGPYDSGGPAC